MKKLITVIAAGFICMAAQAQDNTTDFRRKMTFGLKAGANYSNVYDEQGDEFHADAKFGLAAGAFLAIPIGTYIGIQPEFLFSQKGFTAKGMLMGGTYTMTRTTNHIDIPLLLSFKPSEFFTIVAGPQYSYMISQSDSFDNGQTTLLSEQEFANEDLRQNMLCLTGGFDITMKHIVLSARAGWDLQENHSDGTSSTPRYKNVWYQGTIGYRFYRN